MANYDAGHYFLTVLMPLREGVVEPGGRVVSHRQCVAELLATLPNGEWLARPGAGDGVYSPCSRSPFARSKRTHFTRLVVIDDLPFNGRQGGDTLLGVLLQTDPLLPQAVDRLPCAWLLWTAEFDACSGGDGELDSWLAEIWQAMEIQWRTLLAHAVGGDAVHGEADFIRHVRRCQIETALPFNDYWPQLPDLQDVSLTLPKYLGIAAVLMLVVVLLGLLLLLFGLPVVWLGLLRGLALAALLALLLAIAWALLAVRSAAARPF
ncbi:MAG: hypothetical protein KGI67_03120, partial [Pseudomonadota bacterium]|nr:hypothetical protein [Pseudomonadota bacterium]